MKKNSLFLFLIIVLSMINGITYTTASSTMTQNVQAYELVDPEGDDKGPGTYVYPTNDVFQPGVFDLTKFYVEYNGTHVIFKVYIKNLGGNPWNGPNGFCLQFPHIFVRTTADLPTNNTTFGLNVALAEDSAWHFALLLAPGWEDKPVPEGQKAALYYANGTVVVQDGVLTIYSIEDENAIVAVVEADVLPDVEHIGDWVFTVALAGYDGFGPMRVRPVTSDPEAEWAFGNGDVGAIAVGVEPRIIDLLAPSDEEQYTMLNSFKVDIEAFTGKPAVIHGYKLKPVAPITKARVVFSAEDPIGDDNGPGYYVYPTNDVFQPGVFDLVKFEVIDAGDKVIFKVYVRNLGDNPWNGPNGFCLQFPHIFVRTTANLPTNNTAFGLNVVVADEYAWHFALLLAPGWGADPVPQGERAAIYYANGTVVVQDEYFKVYVVEEENAIVAEVSKKLLPDVEHIEEWRYVVALAGYDGFGPMRVRPVTSDPEAEWAFGNGDVGAIAVGVEPRIIDLLAPTPEDQYFMLDSFIVDIEAFIGEPAIVFGVPVLAPPLPTVTVTVTKTTTKTITETRTQTVTTTLEKTVTTTTTSTITTTRITTTTITQTQVSTTTQTIPVTQTVTETTTTIQTVVDYTATIAIGIVLLLIGAGIGVAIGRKR